MGKETGIEWTDHTFNPWWGCTKVSPGCDHCYADTLSTRWGMKIWGADADRRFFGDKHWAEPLKWNRDAEKAGERRRVFCGSMCDWAEGRPDQQASRDQLFDLIEQTPNLDWQLLTKRPGAIPHLIPPQWLRTPRPNVWFGTSVENQEQADRRIPQLLAVPAVVRFLSAEPLLGPVDLSAFHIGWSECRECGAVYDPNPEHPLGADRRCVHCYTDRAPEVVGHHLHWVIAGGESGPGARPMHPEWARGLRDQSQAAGVAFHFKQWGEWRPFNPKTDPAVYMDSPDAVLRKWHPQTDTWRAGKKEAGRILDGVEWSEFPQVAV